MALNTRIEPSSIFTGIETVSWRLGRREDVAGPGVEAEEIRGALELQ